MKRSNFSVAFATLLLISCGSKEPNNEVGMQTIEVEGPIAIPINRNEDLTAIATNSSSYFYSGENYVISRAVDLDGTYPESFLTPVGEEKSIGVHFHINAGEGLPLTDAGQISYCTDISDSSTCSRLTVENRNNITSVVEILEPNIKVSNSTDFSGLNTISVTRGSTVSQAELTDFFSAISIDGEGLLDKYVNIYLNYTIANYDRGNDLVPPDRSCFEDYLEDTTRTEGYQFVANIVQATNGNFQLVPVIRSIISCVETPDHSAITATYDVRESADGRLYIEIDIDLGTLKLTEPKTARWRFDGNSGDRKSIAIPGYFGEEPKNATVEVVNVKAGEASKELYVNGRFSASTPVDTRMGAYVLTSELKGIQEALHLFDTITNKTLDNRNGTDVRYHFGVLRDLGSDETHKWKKQDAYKCGFYQKEAVTKIEWIRTDIDPSTGKDIYIFSADVRYQNGDARSGTISSRSSDLGCPGEVIISVSDGLGDVHNMSLTEIDGFWGRDFEFPKMRPFAVYDNNVSKGYSQVPQGNGGFWPVKEVYFDRDTYSLTQSRDVNLFTQTITQEGGTSQEQTDALQVVSNQFNIRGDYVDSSIFTLDLTKDVKNVFTYVYKSHLNYMDLDCSPSDVIWARGTVLEDVYNVTVSCERQDTSVPITVNFENRNGIVTTKTTDYDITGLLGDYPFAFIDLVCAHVRIDEQNLGMVYTGFSRVANYPVLCGVPYSHLPSGVPNVDDWYGDVRTVPRSVIPFNRISLNREESGSIVINITKANQDRGYTYTMGDLVTRDYVPDSRFRVPEEKLFALDIPFTRGDPSLDVTLTVNDPGEQVTSVSVTDGTNSLGSHSRGAIKTYAIETPTTLEVKCRPTTSDTLEDCGGIALVTSNLNRTENSIEASFTFSQGHQSHSVELSYNSNTYTLTVVGVYSITRTIDIGGLKGYNYEGTAHNMTIPQIWLNTDRTSSIVISGNSVSSDRMPEVNNLVCLRDISKISETVDCNLISRSGSGVTLTYNQANRIAVLSSDLPYSIGGVRQNRINLYAIGNTMYLEFEYNCYIKFRARSERSAVIFDTHSWIESDDCSNLASDKIDITHRFGAKKGFISDIQNWSSEQVSRFIQHNYVVNAPSETEKYRNSNYTIHVRYTGNNIHLYPSTITVEELTTDSPIRIVVYTIGNVGSFSFDKQTGIFSGNIDVYAAEIIIREDFEDGSPNILDRFFYPFPPADLPGTTFDHIYTSEVITFNVVNKDENGNVLTTQQNADLLNFVNVSVGDRTYNENGGYGSRYTIDLKYKDKIGSSKDAKFIAFLNTSISIDDTNWASDRLTLNYGIESVNRKMPINIHKEGVSEKKIDDNIYVSKTISDGGLRIFSSDENLIGSFLPSPFVTSAEFIASTEWYDWTYDYNAVIKNFVADDCRIAVCLNIEIPTYLNNGNGGAAVTAKEHDDIEHNFVVSPFVRNDVLEKVIVDGSYKVNTTIGFTDSVNDRVSRATNFGEGSSFEVLPGDAYEYFPADIVKIREFWINGRSHTYYDNTDYAPDRVFTITKVPRSARQSVYSAVYGVTFRVKYDIGVNNPDFSLDDITWLDSSDLTASVKADRHIDIRLEATNNQVGLPVRASLSGSTIEDSIVVKDILKFKVTNSIDSTECEGSIESDFTIASAVLTSVNQCIAGTSPGLSIDSFSDEHFSFTESDPESFTLTGITMVGYDVNSTNGRSPDAVSINLELEPIRHTRANIRQLNKQGQVVDSGSTNFIAASEYPSSVFTIYKDGEDVTSDYASYIEVVDTGKSGIYTKNNPFVTNLTISYISSYMALENSNVELVQNQLVFQINITDNSDKGGFIPYFNHLRTAVQALVDGDGDSNKELHIDRNHLFLKNPRHTWNDREDLCDGDVSLEIEFQKFLLYTCDIDQYPTINRTIVGSDSNTNMTRYQRVVNSLQPLSVGITTNSTLTVLSAERNVIEAIENLDFDGPIIIPIYDDSRRREINDIPCPYNQMNTCISVANKANVLFAQAIVSRNTTLKELNFLDSDYFALTKTGCIGIDKRSCITVPVKAPKSRISGVSGKVDINQNGVAAVYVSSLISYIQRLYSTTTPSGLEIFLGILEPISDEEDSVWGYTPNLERLFDPITLERKNNPPRYSQ